MERATRNRKMKDGDWPDFLQKVERRELCDDEQTGLQEHEDSLLVKQMRKGQCGHKRNVVDKEPEVEKWEMQLL